MASWGSGHHQEGGGQEGQAGVHLGCDRGGGCGGLWYFSSVYRLDEDFRSSISFIVGCVTGLD